MPASHCAAEVFEQDNQLDVKTMKSYEKKLSDLNKAIHVYQAGLDEAIAECESC